MNPFLMGLLGAVVGALALALVAWWWFRRKLRRLAEGLGEYISGLSAAVPPFRITLRKDADPDWHDVQVVGRATSELERLGYQRAGDFVVPELNDMPLRGFAHPESGVVAALYENPANDLLVADLVAFYFDDTSCTVSNAPETGLERPPFARLLGVDMNLNANPLAVVELHDAVSREREGRRMDEVPVERFAECFTKAWARTMDWHVERGGVGPDEVRRVAELGGQPPPDDAAVELVREQWTAAIREFVEERIQDRFLRTGAMSAADWEAKRDRVRFIHERMDLPDLIDTLAWAVVESNSHIDADEDEDEEAEDQRVEIAREPLQRAFNGASVRDGFRSALPLMPEHLRWEYLCKVAGDYPADVYLMPQDADDYEDDFDD